MADRKTIEKRIQFKGGVLTDQPLQERLVEDSENLIPSTGGHGGLHPREGLEPVIQLTPTLAEGAVPHMIRLEDKPSSWLVALQNCSGSVNEITDLIEYVEQYGRVMPPLFEGGDPEQSETVPPLPPLPDEAPNDESGEMDDPMISFADVPVWMGPSSSATLGENMVAVVIMWSPMHDVLFYYYTTAPRAVTGDGIPPIVVDDATFLRMDDTGTSGDWGAYWYTKSEAVIAGAGFSQGASTISNVVLLKPSTTQEFTSQNENDWCTGYENASPGKYIYLQVQQTTSVLRYMRINGVTRAYVNTVSVSPALGGSSISLSGYWSNLDPSGYIVWSYKLANGKWYFTKIDPRDGSVIASKDMSSYFSSSQSPVILPMSSGVYIAHAMSGNDKVFRISADLATVTDLGVLTASDDSRLLPNWGGADDTAWFTYGYSTGTMKLKKVTEVSTAATAAGNATTYTAALPSLDYLGDIPATQNPLRKHFRINSGFAVYGLLAVIDLSDGTINRSVTLEDYFGAEAIDTTLPGGSGRVNRMAVDPFRYLQLNCMGSLETAS